MFGILANVTVARPEPSSPNLRAISPAGLTLEFLGGAAAGRRAPEQADGRSEHYDEAGQQKRHGKRQQISTVDPKPAIEAGIKHEHDCRHCSSHDGGIH